MHNLPTTSKLDLYHSQQHMQFHRKLAKIAKSTIMRNSLEIFFGDTGSLNVWQHLLNHIIRKFSVSAQNKHVGSIIRTASIFIWTMTFIHNGIVVVGGNHSSIACVVIQIHFKISSSNVSRGAVFGGQAVSFPCAIEVHAVDWTTLFDVELTRVDTSTSTQASKSKPVAREELKFEKGGQLPF